MRSCANHEGMVWSSSIDPLSLNFSTSLDREGACVDKLKGEITRPYRESNKESLVVQPLYQVS